MKKQLFTLCTLAAVLGMVFTSCKKSDNKSNSFKVDIVSTSGASATMQSDDFTIGFYPNDAGLDSVIIEGEEADIGSDLRFLITVDSFPQLTDTAGFTFDPTWGLLKGCTLAFFHPDFGSTWMHGEGGHDGHVKITSYDEAGQVVDGTFSGYIVDSGSMDTIFFNNGSFHIDQ